MENRQMNDECVDGGVLHKFDDAHRIIECTELTAFHCVFSLLALAEPGMLGNRVYRVDAVLENGVVKGQLDWYCCGDGERVPFEAEPSFMDKLQEIVAKYDLAQHNGFTHTVNGLPDMYGAKLDIRYGSDESIYAYNNEDCFLPMKMMEESVELFKVFFEKQRKSITAFY